MIIFVTLLRIYEVILMVRIFMSWTNPDPSHPVTEWVYRLTEPVLGIFRRLLPVQAMGIDFSPIAVFLIIDAIKRLLVGGRILF
jgi:YggT family protein